MCRKSLTVLDITKMKEKLLIVGAGGFGRVTLEHAIKDFDCSFVDDGKSIGEEINGVKVVGGMEVHHDSFIGDFCCIYTNSVIRTYAKVEDGVKIGSNVTIKNESVVYNDIDDGETI